MDLEGHAASSLKQAGLRAEDIHRWIDGYFDPQEFARFLSQGRGSQYDPFAHRKHRHCTEALEEALKTFAGRYTPEDIRRVFETHLKDDYEGYLPRRADFEDPGFLERYHSPPDESRATEVLAQAEQDAYFHPEKKPKDRKDSGFLLRITLPSLAVLLLFISTEIIFIEPVLHSLLMDGKKEMLEELVSTAASAVTFYQDMEAKGLMERAEAQAEAALEISKIRYGADSKDYFWITDYHPRMVMHPYRPELVGQDLRQYRDREDKSGILLFVEALRVSESTGRGFLRYRWQWKDDPSRTAPKLSFVERIPGWDWVIGSGVYIDDVEKEMNRLSGQFFLLSALVTLAAAGILWSVVRSSGRIEKRRRLAEEGLREARDRYRALVRASREAVGLVVGGRFVYANPQLSRLCGYTGDELCRLGPPDLLAGWKAEWETAPGFADQPLREPILDLQTRDTGKIPVLVTLSRAYFSREQGLVLSLRRASGGLEALEGFRVEAAPSPPGGDNLPFQESFTSCRTPGDLLTLRRRAMGELSAFLAAAGNPGEIRTRIAGHWESYTLGAIALAEREMGPAPGPWCFFALGSSARREMTLWSDQDHGIIFDSGPESDPAPLREYCLTLGNRVTSLLEEAGYRRCPGGIMAGEALWCRSAGEWTRTIEAWKESDQGEAALRLQVMADRRAIYGELPLMGYLEEALTLAGRTPALLGALARRSQELQVGSSLVSSLRREPREEDPGIQVKSCLSILEHFARLYALREALSVPGTLDRIRALGRKGVLPEGLCREFEAAFDQLWALRFELQLGAWIRLERTDDELGVRLLPLLRRRQISLLLDSLKGYTEKISRDFLGGAL